MNAIDPSQVYIAGHVVVKPDSPFFFDNNGWRYEFKPIKSISLNPIEGTYSQRLAIVFTDDDEFVAEVYNAKVHQFFGDPAPFVTQFPVRYLSFS